MFASGVQHSVRDWLDIAFGYLGLRWQDFLKTDQRFMRKADPSKLVGDISEAYNLIGWKPETSFEDMVKRMVDADMN